MLSRERRLLKIVRGLVAIGKTRFGTMYWSGLSGDSLKGCLPAIQSIVGKNYVLIPVRVQGLHVIMVY